MAANDRARRHRELDLLDWMRQERIELPTLVMTGHSAR